LLLVPVFQLHSLLHVDKERQEHFPSVEAAWRVPTNADDWFNEMVTLLRLRCQAYQMRDAGRFGDAAGIAGILH